MTIQVITLDQVPSELVERFADGNGVLWIGAGVSGRREEEQPDGNRRMVGVPGPSHFAEHLRKRLERTGAASLAGKPLDELAMRYESRYVVSLLPRTGQRR